MEVLQLVEEASRPLREEVAALKLVLARVGDSLESTEACTSGGLGIAPTEEASLPLDSIEQKSSVVEEEHTYGCFSPRGSPCPSLQPDVRPASESEGIDGIMAPVIQTTPELHDLCEVSPVVLPLGLGSSEALAVSTPLLPPQPEPCQSPASVDCGGVLAPTSDALFVKELCGLLASLEAVSPGYGKDIACVLAGKASENLIMKVEKSLKVSLWSKRRKRGAA